MHITYRFTTMALGAIVVLLLILSPCRGQQTDFAARHKAIQERFEKSKGQVRNKAVHSPPMIKAQASDLGNDEPVIGVNLNNDARAYPLAMLFGGGGIFELLNDTCGDQPIAVSW